MYSTEKLFSVALVLVQLLGTIQGGSYDVDNNWVIVDKAKDIPENSVLAGFDPNGYYTYVGRIAYSSSILPARIIPELGRATFNTDTISGTSNSYEVLVTNATVSYHWVRSFDGYREKNAVSVGTSSSNDRVFVCRTKSEGGLLIGTLYLAQRKCIIKYEDLPLRTFDKYEVLVRKTVAASWEPLNAEVVVPIDE